MASKILNDLKKTLNNVDGDYDIFKLSKLKTIEDLIRLDNHVNVFQKIVAKEIDKEKYLQDNNSDYAKNVNNKFNDLFITLNRVVENINQNLNINPFEKDIMQSISEQIRIRAKKELKDLNEEQVLEMSKQQFQQQAAEHIQFIKNTKNNLQVNFDNLQNTFNSDKCPPLNNQKLQQFNNYQQQIKSIGDITLNSIRNVIKAIQERNEPTKPSTPHL